MQKRQKQTDIFKKAADLVARRPHFVKELELKLLQRGYDKESILSVIKDFQQKGFLNDEEVAKLYIDELRAKRHSRYDVRERLINRGLQRNSAEELVRTFFLENDERANIRYLLSKKRFSLDDFDSVKKASDFLLRKGFSIELIRETIGRKGIGDHTED